MAHIISVGINDYEVLFENPKIMAGTRIPEVQMN